jgi:hypothetical protein
MPTIHALRISRNALLPCQVVIRLSVGRPNRAQPVTEVFDHHTSATNTSGPHSFVEVYRRNVPI